MVRQIESAIILDRELARASFSYINHKFQSGDSDFDNNAQFPFATHRLVFAGAVFTDSAICYSFLPPMEKGELVGIWDESWMGQEQKVGWLGKPATSAIHLAEKQGEWLAKLTPQELLARFQGAGLDFFLGSNAIKIAVNDANANAMRFKIVLPTNGADLVVTFDAKAAPSRGNAPGVARMAQINLGSNAASALWINQNAFKYSHYRGDARGDQVELNFEIEGSEPLWLSKIAAYACPDAMYREFENGFVIANPPLRAFTFDLPALFPDKIWRRLRGSSLQDTKTNDGSVVHGAITLGARDAVSLVRL